MSQSFLLMFQYETEVSKTIFDIFKAFLELLDHFGAFFKLS
jgi:hypothetical protein